LLKGADQGYGYVDEVTLELTIAVAPEYRGQGVGAKLLAYLLAEAKNRYKAISLSVSPKNPALRLYQRFGFEIVATDSDSLTMIKRYGPSG
jgi:ribosomal protein S18 acetylase RimI-like enzyme